MMRILRIRIWNTGKYSCPPAARSQISTAVHKGHAHRSVQPSTRDTYMGECWLSTVTRIQVTTAVYRRHLHRSVQLSTRGYSHRSVQLSTRGYPHRSVQLSTRGYPHRSVQLSTRGYPHRSVQLSPTRDMYTGKPSCPLWTRAVFSPQKCAFSQNYLVFKLQLMRDRFKALFIGLAM
jgi:hypothetical protein